MARLHDIDINRLVGRAIPNIEDFLGDIVGCIEQLNSEIEDVKDDLGGEIDEVKASIDGEGGSVYGKIDKLTDQIGDLRSDVLRLERLINQLEAKIH